MVCIESIIMSLGFILSASAITRSSEFSAKTSISLFAPRRIARNFNCEADSSPETYSTGKSDVISDAVFISKVDFPIPGSPPMSTAIAGTIPPPKTRSNSDTPVLILSVSVMSISFSRMTCDSVSDAATDAGTSFGGVYSLSEFHAPQAGQQPNHLPDSNPHSEHKNTVELFFAITDYSGITMY